MLTGMWPIEDFPEINVHSYIGVIIAIAGNILISVALNVQKYAHNQLQPGLTTDAKIIQTSPTCIVEEGPIDSHYDTRHYQNSFTPLPVYHDNSDDDEDDIIEDDVRVSIHSYPSSQGSRRSSIHSNHNSDTSVQSETIAGPPTANGIDEFYTQDAASDTEYLRSKAWWLGMVLMILGECGNFLAYGYAQASIVAPLGTVALVSNVILAPLMLKEPFRRRDLVGVLIAIIGTVVVVINSKENEIKLTPEAVVAALLQTQFIVYFIVCCVLVAVLASLSDTIGTEYIFIDLGIVAIFGGYTVLATKGVSSLVSLSFYKMFTYPIAYLLVFVMVSTAVLQIKFLNKSLQRFDSTQVIPTQFVLFTASAIIGSGILYNDFNEMDFNKAFNFLTGCCMTFLGVYFITSHRDIDQGLVPVVANADWALASQTHFAPIQHRASMDSYTTGRALYPLTANRSESLMEQGRTSVPTVGYVIPLPPPNRPTRYGTAPESLGNTNATTPLLGTSLRHSVPGPKDQISFITSSVHSALATVGSAVGTHHTALLSLESMYGNVRKGDERRGSIQSLSHTPAHLQRPPLGSRSSSACSDVFPSPSLATHPSSASLVPPQDQTHYGTSLQSPTLAMQQHHPRASTGIANDPRFQAPHLQERSTSVDSHQQKQPRRKMSTPHLSKEQQKEIKPSGGASSLRIKTSTSETPGGVAFPRRKGDRHMFHSPSEHDFVAGAARSLDSISPSTPKAAPARFLPGAVLSASPTNHVAQGSEYAFRTLKSPTGASMASGRAASVFSDQGIGASLPPLPPVHPDSSTHQPHQQLPQLPQQPQNQRKKKKRASVVYDSDSSSVPLQQHQRKQSLTKDEDGTGPGLDEQ